jgi:hypothetical protein
MTLVRRLITSFGLRIAGAHFYEAGSWGSVADHQANVFGGDINGEQAIDWYISQGVHPSKAR